MSKVTQLSMNNIHSIRLVSNSGAQYDASVNAVIEIITIKKDEGIAIDLNAGARDLFRKLEYEENAQYNNIHFYQVEDYSSWNFFIDVIFRLNQPQKEKYRGKSAAKAETDEVPIDMDVFYR